MVGRKNVNVQKFEFTKNAYTHTYWIYKQYPKHNAIDN